LICRKIPAKHGKQIAERLLLIAENPSDVPSAELKGYAPYRRAKSGEYRIVFRIENSTVFVSLIGKRRDDEIYQMLSRALR
jgi:mRNA interferase RelE/StbE